jgi:hypothetical protein
VDTVGISSISSVNNGPSDRHTARANDTDTKTRAIFVLAAKLPPHAVYGNPFYDHAGFLNVFSVDSNGSLDKNIQNAELDERSAIHGMVFDSREEYLYSADMWANKIWCHKKVRSIHLTATLCTNAFSRT